MSNDSRIPAFRWYAVLLGMLSLSIGWGIRGNFGHEFGAMIAGTLCGIAVSLASGRAGGVRRSPHREQPPFGRQGRLVC